MNILKTVSLIILLGLNGFVLLSMSLGCKGIKDKTAKKGLSVLRICLIADIMAVIGGVALW